jgi:murein DD-endopeptidase MepM/ murein hydrolase activator NlpD
MNNKLTPLGYVLIALILVFTTGFGYLLAKGTSSSKPKEENKKKISKKIKSQSSTASKKENTRKKIKKTEKYIIQQGDTFEKVTDELGLKYPTMQKLVSSSQSVFDVTRLNVGQPVYLLEQNDNFAGIEYEINTNEKLVIRKNDGKLSAEKKKIDYKISTSTAQGTISSSLFKAGKKVGLSEELILELAEIFAWNIDFAVEMEEGDKFKIIYEKKKRKGKVVDTGDILAAKFINDGEKHTAFLFKDGQGPPSYFDKDGQSLKRQFLKAPLEYSRISSGYTNARFHPTLNKTTPHKAIDYAAKLGTPIRAVGDGRVVFAGWNGGYGNYINVRHNGTYQTQYAHLSKIAVNQGEQVKQGEVIGYVGSTGFSTGPHLHYQIKKHGTKVNPLEVELPAGDPVPKHKRDEFEKTKDRYIDKIQIN